MKHLAFTLIILSISSCQQELETVKEPKVEQEYKSGITYEALIKNVITGDFNGDGKEDELKETLVGSIDKKSIDALPQIEYDSLVILINEKSPILSLRSENNKVPELILSRNPSFGLLYLKNEGDLNRDGSDEVSVVVEWADYSQVNSCIVYTLNNGKWIEYAKFEIREWQISQNPNFKGFISKNDKGNYYVSTLDSEVNEVLKPLKAVLVTDK